MSPSSTAAPAMDLSPQQRWLLRGCIASYLALCALCVAWEWLLAPLRPGGSWMVLKAVPLALPLLFPPAALLRGNVYTLQWASMLVLLYFTEGVTRWSTDVGLSAGLAATETLLSVVAFCCMVLYLRPFKQQAKQRKTASASR